jgi:nicotinate phosphoribosyltransferase
MKSSHIPNLYHNNLALAADLYHLTMAYGFWKNQLYDRKAVFQLYFRKSPFGQSYAIASGLGLVIDYLRRFEFSTSDIQYLGSLKGADDQPLFEIAFLNYLQRLKFNCDVVAVPEGTIVFPNEPLIQVTGPVIQAQIIESALLSLINFSTLIATKAGRVVQAADGDPVLEFGMRRAQGLDGGITASRAAYIGGCDATSNLLAGANYGIPVRGTHAHSWVMAFDDEPEAFHAYAKTLPNNCTFLVDTYDTIEGIQNAIEQGKWLRSEGHELQGIRLDSGDLNAQSQIARKMLDEAGFPNAAIIASDNLDEASIRELKANGAKINVWGVGTHLVTGGQQAALGGVYKLAAIEDEVGLWQYRIKKSADTNKMSNPGIHQVYRYVDQDQIPQMDVVFDVADKETLLSMVDFQGQKHAIDPNWQASKLLTPIFKTGKLVYDAPNIADIRLHSLNQQRLFAQTELPYRFGLDSSLYQLKQEMANPNAKVDGMS